MAARCKLLEAFENYRKVGLLLLVFSNILPDSSFRMKVYFEDGEKGLSRKKKGVVFQERVLRNRGGVRQVS